MRVSLRMLRSSHVRDRDKGILWGIMAREIWNGFLLERARGELVPCRFCGEADVDGHLFWECSYLPLVQISENPEFHALVQRDKSNWPRCLHWHGWLPALAYPGGRSPWAETAQDIVIRRLERAYGAYSADVLREWDPSQHSGKGLSALRAPQYPNVWTDGSLVADELAGTASAGAGVFAHVSGSCWFYRRWGHLELLPNDQQLGVERCTLYSSLPGPLQSVQRAEMWGVILALQAAHAVHLGVDNLNVVRHVFRILAGWSGARPFELCVDGDLLSLIADLIQKRVVTRS